MWFQGSWSGGEHSNVERMSGVAVGGVWVAMVSQSRIFIGREIMAMGVKNKENTSSTIKPNVRCTKVKRRSKKPGK